MTDYLIESIGGLTYSYEKLYFFSHNIFALLVYDCDSKNLNILDDFPKEVQQTGAFEKIYKLGKKVYLFPGIAEDIYYYDLEKREYCKLNIFPSVTQKLSKRKNLEILSVDGKLYCVCRHPNIVICIDSMTDDFQIYDMPPELLVGNELIEDTIFSVEIRNDRLVYPYSDHVIVEFLINDNVFRVNYLERCSIKAEKHYSFILGLCFDNCGSLWIYDLSGKVFKVIENKMIELDMPKNFKGIYYDGYHDQPGIDRMYAIGDYLCFILRYECKILKYNISTGEFEWHENKMDKWDNESRQIAFLNCAQIDRDTFWLYNLNDGAVYKWNVTRGFVDKIEFKVSIIALLKSQYKKDYWWYRILQRNDLEGYIQYVNNECKSNDRVNNLNYGEKIYQELIK